MDTSILQLRQLPEMVIVETTEYKCLQSQFSVLYNESMQLKTQLDEARQLLHNSKNTHLRQIELMEVHKLTYLKLGPYLFLILLDPVLELLLDQYSKRIYVRETKIRSYLSYRY